MITIKHFSNKNDYKNRSNIRIIQETDIVSYTTKKGKIKVVKNRFGPQGKFTKNEFFSLLNEEVFIDVPTKKELIIPIKRDNEILNSIVWDDDKP